MKLVRSAFDYIYCRNFHYISEYPYYLGNSWYTERVVKLSEMCVTICGRFCPNEGAVAGYGNRIRAKYTAKWGVQIAGMIFQTGSKVYA